MTDRGYVGNLLINSQSFGDLLEMLDPLGIPIGISIGNSLQFYGLWYWKFPYQAVFDQLRHQTLGQNVDFPLVFEGFWRNNKISVVPGRRREEG